MLCVLSDAAKVTAEPVDAQTQALVDGAKAALGSLAFVALGVASQGDHDFTEMLTILTLVRQTTTITVAYTIIPENINLSE